MTITLALNNLQSRITRTNIAGDSGVRLVTSSSSSNSGGILGGILGKSASFFGWATARLFQGAGSRLGTLVRWLIAGVSSLYSFNWNITDENLDAQVKNLYIALSEQAGETVGNAAGYLLCGAVPASAIMVFNEPLGAYLLEQVTEEAYDEFVSNFYALTQFSAKTLAIQLMSGLYKNTRRLIKKAVSEEGKPEGNFLREVLGGGLSSAIDNWGKAGSEPWSFRTGVEDWIDNISNPFLESFTEGAYEGFLEGCYSAGYVIAYGLDTWAITSRLQEQARLSTEVIEVTPDRTVPQEKILLAGSPADLRTAIPQTIAHYQLLDNRDVGQIVGEPIREYLRKTPSSLSLQITMRGTASPPFLTSDGKQAKRVTISIPDIDRSKLDWETIKLYLGGANGYLWGNYRATAKLSNNAQMAIYASTAEVAKDRLIDLLKLSNAELLTLSVTEEKREGVKSTNLALHKDAAHIYPAFMTINNRQKVLNEEQGRATLTGTYKERRYRIPLWTDTKPDDFEQIINDLIITPG